MKPMGSSENKPARRVAFYGGSFDPPHGAHLAVARAAQKALALDEVLFAPVGTQPLKRNGASASFAQRVEMTRLAIAEERGFSLSLADAPRTDQRPNFTIDTLQTLKRSLSADCQLFCLMGADSLTHLRRWHKAAEILFAATLIVAARPGESLAKLSVLLPAEIASEPSTQGEEERNGVLVREFSLRNRQGQSASLFLLPGLDYDLSASRIREQLRSGSGQAMAELPAAVADYLRAHRIYR